MEYRWQTRSNQQVNTTFRGADNCYAYVIGVNSENTKCSDNGEPSGTAGKPILEVITGAGITNVLIVVIRYFGGVLLGTGGLVRAYTQAAQAGLAASEIGEKIFSQMLTIKVGYNMINGVPYYLSQNEIAILESRYEADVSFDICVKEADVERVMDGLTQKCEGQIEIIKGDGFQGTGEINRMWKQQKSTF